MSCEQTRELILDRDLQQAECQRLAVALKHLEGCPGCQEALRDFDVLRNTLQTPARPADDADQAAAERWMPGSAPPQLRTTGRLWWRGLGVAAVVLIGLMGWLAGRWSSPGGKDSPGPVFAELTEADASRQLRLFQQVAGVFDGRAGWVLLANGSSDMGLAAQPVRAGQEVLVLRLSVVKQGRVLSVAEVVIVPGISAKLNVPLAAGQSIEYEIGTSPAHIDEVSLWGQVQSGQGNAMGMIGTHVHLPSRQDVAAGWLLTTSGAYELRVAGYLAPLAKEPV